MVFDVLITGAGPAGCAAAIRAASLGLHVALIERTAFPRDLPGEALHPDVDGLFAELNVTKSVAAADFIRNPGWTRQTSNERSFIPFLGPFGLQFGYQAWRSKFDSLLLHEARRAGVTVAQPARTGQLLRAPDGLARLELDGVVWSGRYVVDATGSSQWLARSFHLGVRKFSPKLIARYAYISEPCDLGVIPEFREHASGWTWLARVSADCCQCVQLSLDPKAALPPSPAPFHAARFRGADVTWRLIPECAGPGYFLCGDAAAVLDPAASSGVGRALASGLKAADLIAEVLGNILDARTAAADYRRWCAHQFADHATQLAARYAEFGEAPSWLEGLGRQFAELEQFLSNPLANAENSVITS